MEGPDVPNEKVAGFAITNPFSRLCNSQPQRYIAEEPGATRRPHWAAETLSRSRSEARFTLSAVRVRRQRREKRTGGDGRQLGVRQHFGTWWQQLRHQRSRQSGARSGMEVNVEAVLGVTVRPFARDQAWGTNDIWDARSWLLECSYTISHV